KMENNKIKLNEIVTSIKVIKKFDILEITYILMQRKKIVIKLTKNSFFGRDQLVYELVSPKEQEEMKDIFSYSSEYRELDDLIKDNTSLKFIDKIKNSVLYFPTYRRVDSDMIQFLENNSLQFDSDDEFNQIRRFASSFPEDRRVIGVNDMDIDKLYGNYTEQLRKFNSEGLNKVLRSFIEEMIKSTYKNNLESRKKPPITLYDKAPEQLIELSRQLNIEDINELEVKDYFKKQKKLAERSNAHKQTKPNDQKEKREISQDLQELLLFSLSSLGSNNNLLMRLIDLYDQHIRGVNEKLQSFEYLKEAFEKFFKDKIKIELNNYKVELTTAFKTLSTGEKQLITLLSYAALSLNSSVYKPLIIIDEPELSLHISWQMNLLSTLLKIPNINILLATHSPYIAHEDYQDSIWQLGDIDEY
ncbi:AAA family ATPase, partial [Saccharibacillus sacchari]